MKNTSVDKNQTVEAKETLPKAPKIMDSSVSDLPVQTTAKRWFTKSDWIKFSLFLCLLCGFAAVVVYGLPFFLSLRDESIRNQWIEQLKNMGPKGLLIAFSVQVLQVVVAVIPGEPVEIAMGFLYGTLGGLGVCLLGIFTGTLIILTLVRLLGVSFVKKLIKEDSLNKLNFLHHARSLDIVVFILFLIPGTPKDLLTYFVPLTPMKPLRFLLISTFARIPSVVTSTLVGASLGSNKLIFSIVIFAFTALLGFVGIQINNWYMKKHQS